MNKPRPLKQPLTFVTPLPAVPREACLICKERLSSGRAGLKCNRCQPSQFHVDCLLNWLRVSASCPVCRHRLS